MNVEALKSLASRLTDVTDDDARMLLAKGSINEKSMPFAKTRTITRSDRDTNTIVQVLVLNHQETELLNKIIVTLV